MLWLRLVRLAGSDPFPSKEFASRVMASALLSLTVLFTFFASSTRGASCPSFFDRGMVPQFGFSSSSAADVPNVTCTPLFVGCFSSSLEPDSLCVYSTSVSSMIAFPMVSL